MRGHRDPRVTRMPLSIDIESVGSPCRFHSRTYMAGIQACRCKYVSSGRRHWANTRMRTYLNRQGEGFLQREGRGDWYC
jgi:hypothetical protein